MKARLLLFVLLASGPAIAAESYDGKLVLDVNGFIGGRAGSGTDDSILGGAMLSVGPRITAVRFGGVARIGASRSYSGSPGLDLGAFFSHDFFGLWLDPQLAIAAFWRIDAMARYLPRSGAIGFVSYAAIGLRALGFELAIAGGPELGLHLGSGNDAGFAFEFRIGLDIPEVVRFCQHMSDAKRDQPP